MRREKLTLLAGGALSVLLLGFVSTLDYQQAQYQEHRYCEQVERYRESGGEHGWPDYESKYEEVCSDT